MDEDKQSARVRRFIDRIINWWRDKTPGARAVWVIELILLFAKIFISTAGGNSNGEIAIISYVIFGRWTPGLNLFALTKIVIVILGSTLFILVTRAIVGLLNGVLRAKGKTIVPLVNHILNYIVCILSLYLIFKTLGFNTTTLVASVGSLSLAISMASRDIIADILAGIILVFSGEYQIGSFRGWVCNIGIRCTTLVNAEGSVKNVNNRNVNNVVNLSRRDSCVSTQVSIDYNTPLEEVEEMLRRELPELGKTIPQIVKGPTYIGVASMGRGAMTLSIEAECREEDRWTVGSAMNIGLKRMFDRNHIPMRER